MRLLWLFEQQNGSGFVMQSEQTATGVFNSCAGATGLCFLTCTGLPTFSFTSSNIPTVSLQFHTPTVAGTTLQLDASPVYVPPHLH
jgi:hypothetical protein